MSAPASMFVPRILVVDDEESVRYTLKAVLKRDGYDISLTASGQEALALLRQEPFDIVISDVNMPGMSGLELLAAIQEFDADILVIVITAYGSESIAVDAMKRGAYDYLPKPFANDDLKLTIQRAAERVRLRLENRQLKERLAERSGLGAIIGSCENMRRVYDLIERVAPIDVTVLVTGDSGTGKELVAGAIHSLSPRRGGPFIRVNCAALPENLIESELFGYERGAFSGAMNRRLGKFELAHQGTIFLDEIGDMSLATQTKVLRILQEKEFERVGGQTTIAVDARVIAATNRDLSQAIKDGVFRDDLYYRLNVVNIQLPPLRERVTDIPDLVRHFSGKFATKMGKPPAEFSRAFMGRLLQYSWPGNVRELQNLIERVIILEDESLFAPGGDQFPTRTPLDNDAFIEENLFTLPYKEAKDLILRSFERRYFTRLLEEAASNISQAARTAGMHRKNLYLKLKELQMAPRSEPEPEPED